MKILNLYAGIGGNRKLWGNDHDITAVELNPKIAEIYHNYFPNDNIIVEDAHEYLLNNYKEYDFIWSSPPCPTHSILQIMSVLSDSKRAGALNRVAQYPDMALYQEIILLKHFAPFKCKFVVENVKPYYGLLIPGIELQRHVFWTNFQLSGFTKKDKYRKHNNISGNENIYGFDLKKYSGIDKRKTLRNMVNPELALHILNCAMIEDYREESEQGYLL